MSAQVGRVSARWNCPLLAAACLLCAWHAPCAAAQDFEVVVTLVSGKQKSQTKETRQSPSRRRAPRQVVQLTPGQQVQVLWLARNTSRQQTLQDVIVHFFVVKEEELGQAQVPKLDKNVAYEGALTMDFKPQEKAAWRFQLQLPEPGSYLLRVETLGLLKDHGHEHYAALDLTVK